jgi:hypothetical protein
MSEPTEAPNQPSGNDARLAAEQWVHQLRVFYTHAGVAAASLTVIFAVNLFTNLAAGIAGEWSAWWSVWAFIGQGAGLAVHGLVVRLNRPNAAASSWGQQQIDKAFTR